MKRLIIRNFGPIDNIEIEMKRINLVIGPQSSGKSTLLKVACYCTWVERQVVRTQDINQFCKVEAFLNNLIKFHRLEGYLKPDTYIVYVSDCAAITYDAKKNSCKFRWQEEKLNYQSTKISYLPAERNLVSVIPNWYQVKMEPNNLFAFMNDWEETRKSIKGLKPIMSLQFNYLYDTSNNKDKVVLHNGEQIDIVNASSGLQSLVPLMVTIDYLTNELYEKDNSSVESNLNYFKLLTKILNIDEKADNYIHKILLTNRLFFPRYTSFFIEEPEAHLYPSTQKDFVYTLMKKLNDEKQHFCFIATHSPYIMTSFNNLLLAGEKSHESDVVKSKVLERFNEKQLLNFDEMSAYAIEKGKVVNILDEEYKMIVAENLDGASEEIVSDYDYLLGL